MVQENLSITVIPDGKEGRLRLLGKKKKKKKKKKKEGLSMRIHRSLTLEKVTFTSRGTKPLHRARYHPIAYRYSSRLQENLLVESS